MSTVYKLEYADKIKISTSIFLVIRLFSMIGCIFQRSPGIKNRSLWCLTSTRLGLFGAMCLGGPTGPTRPTAGFSHGSVFPAENSCQGDLWQLRSLIGSCGTTISQAFGAVSFFVWKLDGRKIENHLPGPSKKCQLNPKGWWIETL